MFNFSADLSANIFWIPVCALLTKAVLKACIPARAALKSAGRLLPDQGLLVNILPMLEAKDSSRIENIVTTSDQLFQYVDHAEQADPATKEALLYRTAMYDGVELLKTHPLCVRVAMQICTKLRAVETDVRKTSGTVLLDQYMNVVYTPPEGEEKIRTLLSNWEQFINEQNDIDPLIKMAMAHYQFESIHPFPAGNGCTGKLPKIYTYELVNMLFMQLYCRIENLVSGDCTAANSIALS